ncbi:M23 family metallopeptidase [Streptomyces sp. WMMB 322]|uniref:M23 family metallopeptidase n=1 Tax=Streptomyces sp. WMMB 322 TaxID=1286821 RepID=UPI0006E36CC2|nr:M23 family metallopeptidase [Streptomyces sp. WMMB 322]SCK50139.1 Murein DD-endopeptidase MepM and murein hydrolase activator NlpD, contain LysM domain [Streptomyces sp. WMMB 322]
MAFIRATGTHRRTRPMSRRAKAAGIAGLTFGVVGSLASPALAETGGQPQAASSGADKTVEETSGGTGQDTPRTTLHHAVGFGDAIADTVSDQARLQEAAAAQAKAAKEAERKAAAEKAKREREAREKAARAAERKKLNAYVAPVEGASVSVSYQSSGGLWSSGAHTGIDFQADEGTEVRSVAAGEVVEAGADGSFGNSVVIKHRDGTYTQYGHLSSVAVSAGQQVKPGQKIALSGSTGNTTGPHLHFEARTSSEYGSDMDPVAYLRQHGVAL